MPLVDSNAFTKDQLVYVDCLVITRETPRNSTNKIVHLFVLFEVNELGKLSISQLEKGLCFLTTGYVKGSGRFA